MASRANSWRSYRPPSGPAAGAGAGSGSRVDSNSGARVAPASVAVRERRETVRVLGLDPGSQRTGFGIVECGPQGTRYVASGTIVAKKATASSRRVSGRSSVVASMGSPTGSSTGLDASAAARLGQGAESTAADDFAARLQQIYAGVAAVVAEHRPTEIAVERVFVHRNPDSALKLGQARGAALCATFASGAPLHEYSPREVKLAIVGFGAAEKEQVQKMVKALLGLDGRLGADAADALAIALCHAHGRGARLAVAGTGGRAAR